MKTSELVKELEQYGKVEVDSHWVTLRTNGQGIIAHVDGEQQFNMCTNYAEFNELNAHVKSSLFSLLSRYVMTPVDQRKDEPRFKVRLWHDGDYWLNFSHREDGDYILLSDSAPTLHHQTVFTKAQYATLRDSGVEFVSYLPPYDSENTDVFVPVEVGDLDEGY